MGKITKLRINGTEYDIGGSGSSVTVDSALSATSTNPVQNKVVKKAIDDVKSQIPSLSNYYTKDQTYNKEEIDALCGNIEASLDEIIAIQESLIGGASV